MEQSCLAQPTGAQTMQQQFKEMGMAGKTHSCSLNSRRLWPGLHLPKTAVLAPGALCYGREKSAISFARQGCYSSLRAACLRLLFLKVTSCKLPR